MRIHRAWRYHPFGAFDTCPACLGALEPTASEGRANFLCTSCGCCWHMLLGYLSVVDPRTCPGCRLRGLCDPAAFQACVAEPAGRPAAAP
jgi:hypothetical protein